MYFFEIVQGCDYGGYCAVLPEFKTEKEAEKFCCEIMDAIKIKNDWKKAVAEADAIPQEKNVDKTIPDELHDRIMELPRVQQMKKKIMQADESIEYFQRLSEQYGAQLFTIFEEEKQRMEITC